MTRTALALLLLALAACEAGDDPPGSTDAPTTADSAGADAASDAGPGGAADTGHTAALCDRVWGRLESCGHVYTFPTFPDDCAGWLRDGDAQRLETLELCAVYACSRLVDCVEGL